MRHVDLAILGFAGGALTSTCYLPQIAKAWRTKHLADVSPLMLAVMGTGTALWEAYGWALGNVALILANAVALAFIATLLAMWWKWGRSGHRAATHA